MSQTCLRRTYKARRESAAQSESEAIVGQFVSTAMLPGVELRGRGCLGYFASSLKPGTSIVTLVRWLSQ